MKIRIYAIAKKPLHCEDYAKMANQFGAKIELKNLFNAKIAAAQKAQDSRAAQDYCDEILTPFIAPNALNIALSPNGEECDSHAFSEILRDFSEVNFFIGGAFGFAPKFLAKTRNLSLSKLTFSHKIVPLILCEQIYRALCIQNHHPYHK